MNKQNVEVNLYKHSIENRIIALMNRECRREYDASIDRIVGLVKILDNEYWGSHVFRKVDNQEYEREFLKWTNRLVLELRRELGALEGNSEC